MGYGDSLMAVGEARRMQVADPQARKVAIGDGVRVKWDAEVFRGNPRLASQEDVRRAGVPGSGPGIQWLIEGSGHRPYIDYEATLALGRAALGGKAADWKRTLNASPRWVWKDRGPARPGELWFDAGEQAITRRYATGSPLVVIEPTLKARASPNKQWGWERWQALADELNRRGACLVQIGPAGVRRLAGVPHLITASFREACAVLAGARAFVGNEGGLHHAAAALGVRGAVPFGGYISPRLTGYAIDDNFYVDDHAHPLGCGMRAPCAHCAAAMASISVGAVAGAVLKSLS